MRASWSDYLEFAIFRLAYGLFGSLPRGLAIRLGAWLGELFYVFDVPHRRIALRNLAIAFPGKSDVECRAILRRSCRNLGRLGAEFCHLRRLTPTSVRRHVSVEDRERWEHVFAVARQRGAVILTGHVGNFELLAYAHGLLGHPVTLVYRSMRNPLVDRVVVELRGRAGTHSLAKSAAAKAALRALRGRGMVAIPADQNQTRRNGVFVDFFGVPASTTPGPARLAMHTGCAVFPLFLLREGESNSHRIVVLPEVELVRTDDREADIIANTQRCNAVLEQVLRDHPDQWIWFHKRWRTRPAGEAEIY